MEEKQLITEIDICYLEAKPFTQNDIYIIKNLIVNNPTLGNLIKFYSYGEVNFENNRHEKWIIDLDDKFNKNHTNSIIFKIDDNIKYNPHNYEYLVIFQNITKTMNSYGYIWIKENKSLVKYCLDYTYEEILYHLTKDLNFWKVEKLYNTIISDPPKTLKEYNDVYREYIETYRCKNFEDWEDLSKI